MTRHLRRSALGTTREPRITGTANSSGKTTAFHEIASSIDGTTMEPKVLRALKTKIGTAHRSGQLGKGEKRELLTKLSTRKPGSEGPLKDSVRTGRQETPAVRMEEPTVVTIQLPIGLRKTRPEF